LTEHENIMEWAGLYSKETRLLFTLPSSVSIGSAKSPDMLLPFKQGGYEGLFVKLIATNRGSRECYLSWVRALANEGYKGVVCYSDEQAIDVIISYLTEPAG